MRGDDGAGVQPYIRITIYIYRYKAGRRVRNCEANHHYTVMYIYTLGVSPIVPELNLSTLYKR